MTLPSSLSLLQEEQHYQAQQQMEEDVEEDEDGDVMDTDYGVSGPADDDGGPGMSIVLHEDKKYYATAEETYGQGTETLVQEEDAQPIEVPIIAPVRQKKLETEDTGVAQPLFTPEFLSNLLSTPELIRNVAVVGHLHHGKTVVGYGKLCIYVIRVHYIMHYKLYFKEKNALYYVTRSMKIHRI